MGREIRRVPPHWEHPKDGDDFIPLYDRDYESAASAYLQNVIAWARGTHKDLVEDPSCKEGSPYFWDWDGGPPDKDSHRPAWTEEPTWFQMYETVSEGTPVTPAFATKGELVEYLVANGDFWDQARGDGGWNRANAEQFVEREWAPSLMVFTGTASEPAVIKTPRDGA